MENGKPIEEMSFREMMSELDGIIEALEGNKLELEESLEKYERGIALMRSLRLRLSEAQQKVNVLMGELSDVDEGDNEFEGNTKLSKA